MYKLTENGVLLTKEDGTQLSIPNAASNRHWREYQEWLAEGNTPEPEFTEAELKAKADAEAVAISKKTLEDTDYIILKMAEAMVSGGDVEAVKAQYPDALLYRSMARETINLKEG